MIRQPDQTSLPGQDLVERGLADLAQDRLTDFACSFSLPPRDSGAWELTFRPGFFHDPGNTSSTRVWMIASEPLLIRTITASSGASSVMRARWSVDKARTILLRPTTRLDLGGGPASRRASVSVKRRKEMTTR